MWPSSRSSLRLLHGGSDLHFFYSIGQTIDISIVESRESKASYIVQFDKLYKTVLNERPPDIHYGLFRYSAIAAFHESFSKLSPKTNSPLRSIIHNPLNGRGEDRRQYAIPKDILDAIGDYDIYSLFGIDYDKAMNMSYHEWTIARDKAMDIKKKQILKQIQDEEDARMLEEK
jgi:hypothetical protein